MMAARALVGLQRANPKISPISVAVAHRCTLPAVVRLGVSTGGDSGSREKQQWRREIGTSSSSRARALTLLRRRDLHATTRNENTIILAGLGIAASAMAARYGLQAYNDWKAQQPKPESTATQPGKDGRTAGEAQAAGASTASSSFFGAFGKNFYEGGFDDKMTRREAALILGVRESAAPQRIKDAHRRILMINHPDKGGSKYMAAKINEAKEILLKGRE